MPTMAICGSTLMMSAIGAILEKRSDLKMQQLAWAPEMVETLEAAPPAVILFDLAAAFPDFIIAVLQNHPQTKLVGIDLASHRMLVISGATSPFQTADDLARLLGSSAHADPTTLLFPEAERI